MKSEMQQISDYGRTVPKHTDGQQLYYKVKTMQDELDSISEAIETMELDEELVDDDTDVEEEEPKPKSKGRKCRRDRTKHQYKKSISMKSAFAIVVAVHVLAIGGIFLSNSKTLKAAEIKKSDQEFLNSDKYVGVDYPESTPAPQKPVAEKKPIEKKPVEKKIPKADSNWPRPKTHTVSKGDTFYGLVRKYNLDAEKFRQYNKIKDINVLIDGTKLVLIQK